MKLFFNLSKRVTSCPKKPKIVSIINVITLFVCEWDVGLIERVC